MGDPDLVIIDEPTEGLAPKLVEQVANLLDEIARRGISIPPVEQKLTIALKISKRLSSWAMAASSSKARRPSSPPTPPSARNGSKSDTDLRSGGNRPKIPQARMRQSRGRRGEQVIGSAASSLSLAKGPRP
jgi:hypothetical protein